MPPPCKKCLSGVEHEFKHGRSAYQFHRCRCDVCTKANTDYGRSAERRAYNKSEAVIARRNEWLKFRGQPRVAETCAECSRRAVRDGLCARHFLLEERERSSCTPNGDSDD